MGLGPGGEDAATAEKLTVTVHARTGDEPFR